MNKVPLFLEIRAGDQARRGDGARVHHGICPSIRRLLDSLQGIERTPRGVRADSFPGDFRAEELANQRENKRL